MVVTRRAHAWTGSGRRLTPPMCVSPGRSSPPLRPTRSANSSALTLRLDEPLTQPPSKCSSNNKTPSNPVETLHQKHHCQPTTDTTARHYLPLFPYLPLPSPGFSSHQQSPTVGAVGHAGGVARGGEGRHPRHPIHGAPAGGGRDGRLSRLGVFACWAKRESWRRAVVAATAASSAAAAAGAGCLPDR